MPDFLSLNVESPDCLPIILREAARFYCRCAEAERDECVSEVDSDHWEIAAEVLESAADSLDECWNEGD